MSKAFDFVDHKLLLYKLEKYGIRGVANDWIKSYLEDRYQCVEITKIKNSEKVTSRSNFKLNRFGVPQGSVLGPFLFLLYINDLPNITHHKTILFADDTTLIIKCENKETYENEINLTLNKTIEWLSNNNLKINVNKTQLIQFQNYRRQHVDLNINYRNNKIEEVSTAKFLGLMLDKHCNWKGHVEHICNKLDRFVFAIKRLRQTVSTEAALSAYHGYVSSVLSYGLLMWGNSVEIEKAFRVQKKCVRAICGAWSTDSCKPLFKKFHILPLVCMYIRELCVFVKLHPQHFNKFSEKLGRNSKYKFKLLRPRCRLDIYERNVYVKAIDVYNKLPDKFKELKINMFKKKLTAWLAEKCFYTLKEFMAFKENDVII